MSGVENEEKNQTNYDWKWCETILEQGRPCSGINDDELSWSEWVGLQMICNLPNTFSAANNSEKIILIRYWLTHLGLIEFINRPCFTTAKHTLLTYALLHKNTFCVFEVLTQEFENFIDWNAPSGAHQEIPLMWITYMFARFSCKNVLEVETKLRIFKTCLSKTTAKNLNKPSSESSWSNLLYEWIIGMGCYWAHQKRTGELREDELSLSFHFSVFNILLDHIVDDGTLINPTQKLRRGSLSSCDVISSWRDHDLPMNGSFEGPFKRLCNLTYRVEQYKLHLLSTCSNALSLPSVTNQTTSCLVLPLIHLVVSYLLVDSSS